MCNFLPSPYFAGVTPVYFALSSRQSDPKQAYYANEAREFLRKKLIGKHVKVTIDFIRPKEGEFDERECATVRYASHNAWVFPCPELILQDLTSFSYVT